MSLNTASIFNQTAVWRNIPPQRPHLAQPGLLKCHMWCHQSKQQVCVSAWQHGKPLGWRGDLRKTGKKRRPQQGLTAQIPAHGHRHYRQAEKPCVSWIVSNKCWCVLTRWTYDMFCLISPVINILGICLGLMLKKKKNDWWLICLIFLHWRKMWLAGQRDVCFKPTVTRQSLLRSALRLVGWTSRHSSYNHSGVLLFFQHQAYVMFLV